MGRSYAAQLAQLDATYQWAQSVVIEGLTTSVDALRGRPLIVIGSGGSLSAAAFACRLHERYARLPARALTPLEFIRHPDGQASGVLLLSASGRHPDVLAAAAHAIASEYSPIVGLCTTSRTALTSVLSSHRHATTCEFVGPATPDGFLATNSLLLTYSLLARAYRVKLPSALPSLSDSAGALDSSDALRARRTRGPACSTGESSSVEGTAICQLPHLVALADGWAVPAAIDLESRWAESGFGTVAMTDARNFAHGRHHGLSRRIGETLVLGLTVAEEPPQTATAGRRRTREDINASTMRRLPRTAATANLRSPVNAEAGAIDLLVRVMRLAGEVGERSGLDPGRPRVPAFGRVLYHAGIPASATQRDGGDHAPAEDLWIRRKVTPAMWASASEATRETWRAACRAWVSQAESLTVGGVVLDYDGTLCEAAERAENPHPAIGTALIRLIDAGLAVGIATGRGSSVHRALRALMPERVWRSIVLGMYSGSVCCRLDEDPTHLNTMPIAEPLALAQSILSTSPVLSHAATIRSKPTQLTILPAHPLPEGLLLRLVTEALTGSPPRPDVEVVGSDHSVDVIASGTSKLRVVAEVRQVLTNAGRSASAVMTIGDQGQAQGNDASFLAQPLGISVEHASSAFNGCWNVAPRGARRTAALLGYLAALSPAAEGGFRWSVVRASAPAHRTTARVPKVSRAQVKAKRPGKKGVR